ncbi:hypothetical protein EVAR_86114_1 [Eumeta japonica]|uniref:Uncharacterized protein n=1 Tax=Eumeta variegata TaxID=151549 RepID=A0A4C1V1W8_EUMVA|nr:hypothetical protein EVAR_86114_1 [Eumeta japonica]
MSRLGGRITSTLRGGFLNPSHSIRSYSLTPYGSRGGAAPLRTRAGSASLHPTDERQPEGIPFISLCLHRKAFRLSHCRRNGLVLPNLLSYRKLKCGSVRCQGGSAAFLITFSSDPG